MLTSKNYLIFQNLNVCLIIILSKYEFFLQFIILCECLHTFGAKSWPKQASVYFLRFERESHKITKNGFFTF